MDAVVVFRNPSGNVERVVAGASSRPARVPALRVVAVAVGLEVLALAAVVIRYLVGLVGSGAADVLGAVVIAVLAAAAGAGLALCVRGLLAGQRWARAPILTWQLLQLFVAGTNVAAIGLDWLSGLAIAVAVAAAGGLLTPAAVAATRGDADPPLT